MIIALDLALQTGWATRDNEGRIATGTWDIYSLCEAVAPGRDRSVEPALAIYQKLDEVDVRFAIDKVIFESAFAQPGASTWIQCSMQTAVMMWCCRRRPRAAFSRHGSKTWKKELLGNGNATRDQYHHAAIQRWPELTVETNDEAAALWLLEMERKTL